MQFTVYADAIEKDGDHLVIAASTRDHSNRVNVRLQIAESYLSEYYIGCRFNVVVQREGAQ